MLLILAGMAFDHLDSLHNGPLFAAQHLDDAPAFAFFGAGDDHDLVALLHMSRVRLPVHMRLPKKSKLLQIR